LRSFDPVHDSQRTFRALLQATANPGEVYLLPEIDLAPHERILVALLDHEVSFCAVGKGARRVEERLASGTGARIVPLSEADFALFLGSPGRALLELKRGTLEDPEKGATAICTVNNISGRGSLAIRLSGPGVLGTRLVRVGGIAVEELGTIWETRAGYPQGVDLYLVDHGGQVLGLPRSVELEVVR